MEGGKTSGERGHLCGYVIQCQPITYRDVRIKLLFGGNCRRKGKLKKGKEKGDDGKEMRGK